MTAKQSDVDHAYLAQPASSSCWLGTIHNGTPRGNLETVLDVPTYVSRPTPEKAKGHIVLYFPDVWGMSINAQLLMDGFADAGFLTLGMDYFRGVRMNQRGDASPSLFQKIAATCIERILMRSGVRSLNVRVHVILFVRWREGYAP